MDDVNTIEIMISNNSSNNLTYIDVNKMMINYDKPIDKKVLKKLLDIICLWNNEYGVNGIDTEEFNVKIYSDKGLEQFHGKGVYPDNYEEFIKIVGEINGRC